MTIFRYIKICRPDIALFDSDYHFLPFYWTQRPTMLSVNQSYNVLRNYFHFTLLKKIQMLPSFLIELADAFIQILFVDRIFVPTIKRPQKHFLKKIRTSPLIVREVFFSRKRNGDLKSTALILSGTGLEKEKMINWANKEGVDIIQPREGEFHENVFPFPKIMNYRKIACQGGLSTISEVLAAGREISIFPIKNHCEQYSNFYDVKMIKCTTSYSSNRKNFEGSKVIANEIIECLNG